MGVASRILASLGLTIAVVTAAAAAPLRAACSARYDVKNAGGKAEAVGVLPTILVVDGTSLDLGWCRLEGLRWRTVRCVNGGTLIA